MPQSSFPFRRSKLGILGLFIVALIASFTVPIEAYAGGGTPPGNGGGSPPGKGQPPPPPPPKPKPPPAVSINAGPDQTVNEGSRVTLRGSSNRAGASWSQTAGTTVTLSSTTSMTPSFTAPNLLSNQTLTFRLSYGSTRDTVSITVRADNDAPSASAGSDRTVSSGAAVTLSGSGSDPEGGSLSYAWTQTGGTPTVTISDAGQASASFTAPSVASNTALGFRLTVTDSGGRTATDSVVVTVRPSPLSAEAGAAQTVAPGASVTLSGSATGGSGAKTYAWTQTGGSPTVTINNAGQASASFTAPSVTGVARLVFKLTVTAGSETATDTVAVTVSVSAGPPRVTGVSLVSHPLSGDTYKQGETIRAQVWLSGLAVVTGSPQLALGVGTQTRTMSYVGLDRARVLEFEYPVQASDADADGVSIGSSALSLPTGASLADESGGTVGVSLSGHAISNASGHKVDGSQSAASPLPDLNACPADSGD